MRFAQFFPTIGFQDGAFLLTASLTDSGYDSPAADAAEFNPGDYPARDSRNNTGRIAIWSFTGTESEINLILAAWSDTADVRESELVRFRQWLTTEAGATRDEAVRILALLPENRLFPASTEEE